MVRVAALLIGGCAALSLAGTAGAAPKRKSRPPAVVEPVAVVAPGGIRGFRSAVFGMSKPQVLAAITADFGAGVRPVESANAIEGTDVVAVSVASLDPGPGAAVVTYIFGAVSKRLSNVNVAWTLQNEPTAEQRAAVLTAGVRLAAYFQGSLKPVKVTGLTPLGPNTLVLYAAIDDKGAGVQVDAGGVTYRAADPQRPSPAPRGPALVRISYTQNAANPDVLRIRPGSF